MGIYDDYYRQLSEQNSGLGDYAVNSTNDALKSNPNISEFIKSKSNYGLYSPDQNSITTDPKTFLGLDQSTWGGLAAGGQLLGGAIDAYSKLEELGLAKKVADHNMAMSDKQYSMAKDAYDRNVARATSISDQMAKGKVG
jgi:hypothetical protein